VIGYVAFAGVSTIVAWMWILGISNYEMDFSFPWIMTLAFAAQVCVAVLLGAYAVIKTYFYFDKYPDTSSDEVGVVCMKMCCEGGVREKREREVACYSPDPRRPNDERRPIVFPG
jgi:hypothetical protein